MKNIWNDPARFLMGTIFLVTWYVQFQLIARACHTQRALLHACSGKNPATLGYVSVLEFVSIESYLKVISSDYGSNKEY